MRVNTYSSRPAAAITNVPRPEPGASVTGCGRVRPRLSTRNEKEQP